MSGKRLRLSRIMNSDGKTLIMAYSHGVLMGTMDGMRSLAEMRARLAGVREAGATGFLLSPGYAGAFADEISGPGAPGLVATIGWTNLWRSTDVSKLTYPQGATHRVARSPETAMRMGADVAHVYLLLGHEDPQEEAAEITRVADCIEQCDRYGLPVLVETLARGPKIDDPTRPEYVLWAARIGAELGADMLKVEFPGETALRELVDATPVPVAVLGGTPTDDEEVILRQAREIRAAGASGIIYGRTIYQSKDAAGLTARLAEILL